MAPDGAECSRPWVMGGACQPGHCHLLDRERFTRDEALLRAAGMAYFTLADLPHPTPAQREATAALLKACNAYGIALPVAWPFPQKKP